MDKQDQTDGEEDGVERKCTKEKTAVQLSEDSPSHPARYFDWKNIICIHIFFYFIYFDQDQETNPFGDDRNRLSISSSCDKSYFSNVTSAFGPSRADGSTEAP